MLGEIAQVAFGREAALHRRHLLRTPLLAILRLLLLLLLLMMMLLLVCWRQNGSMLELDEALVGVAHVVQHVLGGHVEYVEGVERSRVDVVRPGCREHFRLARQLVISILITIVVVAARLLVVAAVVAVVVVVVVVNVVVIIVAAVLVNAVLANQWQSLGWLCFFLTLRKNKVKK